MTNETTTDETDIVSENVREVIEQIQQRGECTLMRGDLIWLRQIVDSSAVEPPDEQTAS